MQTPFDALHVTQATDESGPVAAEPRIEHFTNPKSKYTGLRKAFGTYNPVTPSHGAEPSTMVRAYFSQMKNLFSSGGLTRVLKSGNNKVVF